MNKKLLKRIFPLIAVLLLAPWPIAYGYEASGAAAEQDTAQITIAEASAAPSVAVFGKAISGVESGDLFYIDATNNTADIQVTLYITNTEELIHNYRYIILKVGVYAQGDDGEWKNPSGNNGEPVPDTFITMNNGQVSFTLPGYAKYKLTIDSGSINCITANGEKGSLSPQFYLEVE
jgi:hypothetical protein